MLANQKKKIFSVIRSALLEEQSAPPLLSLIAFPRRQLTEGSQWTTVAMPGLHLAAVASPGVINWRLRDAALGSIWSLSSY